MNWIFKNKTLYKKTILVGLFLVFGFIFFNFTIEDVSAAESCTYKKSNGEIGTAPSSSQEACTNLCNSTTGYTNCAFNEANLSSAPTPALGDGSNVEASTGPQYNAATAQNKKDDDNMFTTAIKLMLIGVLNFVGWLFAIAATLFAWAIEPSNISGETGILNKQAVMDVWIMVRDILNMTFILILLFAAFCTIFQVDKWNLKKVWSNILINALLVNFSYPIARFFIDVSNVAFYYFINHLFTTTGTVTGSTIFASFGASSMIGDILAPGHYSQYPIASLIAMIAVVFIMGMTLLVIAALFIVRLMMLTILVMFSPIGFVGYIFPSAEKHANNWWSQLFSYSFFAPIMIFMVAASLHITEALGRENFQSFKSNAATNATNGNESNFIAQLAFFAIPVVLLWIGIGTAKSMGIAMADKVVDKVKAGGKWLSYAPWHATGIPGGFKQTKDYYSKRGVRIPFTNRRILGADQTANMEAMWAGMAGVSGAREKNMQSRIKQLKDDSMPAASLRALAMGGDVAAGAILAENGDFDVASYTALMGRIQGPQYQNIRNQIERDTRKKRADILIDHEINTNTNPALTPVQIAQNQLGRLSATQWKDQNMDHMLGYNRANNAPINNAHTVARRQAVANVYGNFNQDQRNNVTRDMSGNNYQAGRVGGAGQPGNVAQIWA